MTAPWEENYAKAPPETGASTNAADKTSKQESPIKVDMPSGVAGALEPPAMAQAAPSPAAQPAAEKKAVATKQPTTETKQEQPLIPDWLKFPAAVGAGGAAVAGAVTGWKTLRDKMNNSAPDAGVERREPTMFGAQRLDEPAWSASTARTPPLSQEEMMNRLRGLADETSAVNEPAFGAFAPAATTEATTAAPSRNLSLEEAQARMAGVAPAAAPVAPVAAPVVPEAAPVIAEAPKPIVPAPVAVAPSRPVVPTPPAALASTTAAPTPTAEPVNPSAYNQRVQTAIAGVPKNVQDQLAKEGKVALKGYGAGDINVTNTYGPSAYQKLVDYFNEGKPIGSYENYLEVNKKIQKGVPASLASEFASTLPASEQEAGNFGKAFGEVAAYTKDGKIVKSPSAIKNAVKGGGAIFLASTIPNLVNAAQRGDTGPLLETAFNVGTGLGGPAVATATQALMGTNAGLSAEEEARQLRMRNYAERAGRGVAQGYDPRRLIGVAPPAR